jgi:hypothetical protein
VDSVLGISAADLWSSVFFVFLSFSKKGLRSLYMRIHRCVYRLSNKNNERLAFQIRADLWLSGKGRNQQME